MGTLVNAQTDLDNFFRDRTNNNFLDVKLKVFEKNDNRIFLPGSKSHNTNGRFQPIHAIEESAVHQSRKIC